MRTRDLFNIAICNFFRNLFVSKVLAFYSHCRKTVALYTDVVSLVPIYLLRDVLSRIVSGREHPLVIKRVDAGKRFNEYSVHF